MVVDEARTQSATRKVRDAIVASDPNQIKPAGKINRVYAPSLSAEDFTNKIKDLYSTDVEIIEPTKPGSESSKFPTFKFNVGDDEIKIVLAKGIIAGEEGERKQETTINAQIEQEGTITLELTDIEGKKHYVEGVNKFTKVPGNKKADFVFTSEGDGNIYVQHKSPSHQQMSGTVKFGGKYSELNEFIEEVRKKVKGSPEGRLMKPMFKPITDPELKKLAVYGEQDGTANGVQVYAVGDLGLEGEGKVKKLTAKRIYVYPEMPEGEDAPVLGATYRTDRNQYGIPNVRFGVYPASYFKGS